jgi:hypothetical protein
LDAGDFGNSRGRYATAVYQPYWNGSGGSESAVQTILSRDVFGEVRHARDFNDLDSYTVSGHLGRGYYSWVETVPGGTPGGVGGRQRWTTYRWCGTGENTGQSALSAVPGQRGDHPAGRRGDHQALHRRHRGVWLAVDRPNDTTDQRSTQHCAADGEEDDGGHAGRGRDGDDPGGYDAGHH